MKGNKSNFGRNPKWMVEVFVALGLADGVDVVPLVAAVVLFLLPRHRHRRIRVRAIRPLRHYHPDLVKDTSVEEAH